MKILSILFLLATGALASSFEEGSGGEYRFRSEGSQAKLSIYITKSSFSELGVEFYFSNGGLLGSEMWQQFVFKFAQNKPLSLQAGYFQVKEMSNPEELESEYLHVGQGVEVTDFLFARRSEIEKFHVGDELVELPAGSLMASHYRKRRNGQTVDFWISDAVKPVGMVKLVSKGPKATQNYTIELSSLLKNVKPKINPSQALPLSENGKSFLPTPKK